MWNLLYPYRNGTFIQSEVVGEIIEFVRTRLQIKDRKLTRDVYSTIMELMINVKEHASRSPKIQEWWLIAYYNSEKNSVTFALLDRGTGIPSTIRKKFKDLLSLSDTELLMSTLLGENRSETRLPYRGKGLPRVYKYIVDGKLKNLYIISKKGYFDSKKAENCNDIDLPFCGTIISWDFIPELTDENN